MTTEKFTAFEVTDSGPMCNGHMSPIAVGATAYTDAEGCVWCAESVQIIGFADKIMTMIDEDIATGKVPADVASFSALHDYVDANMYVIDALEGAFPRGDENAEVMTSDAEVDMSNAVMTEVDNRLADRAGETR